MEITLKITENTPGADLIKTAAFLELLADTSDMTQDNYSEWTDEPAPTEDQQVCEAPEPEADTIDPEALRSQIRALGGKLTVAGKAEALMEVFKKHGSDKLSGLDAAALPEVLAELEAM